MRGREENVLRKERTLSQCEVAILPSLTLWNNNPQAFPRVPPPAPSLQGPEKACPAEDSYGNYSKPCPVAPEPHSLLRSIQANVGLSPSRHACKSKEFKHARSCQR